MKGWLNIMRLKEIIIDNFRNLNNLKVTLNDTNNFIVGENGLGKSNFLDLLEIIFNATSFKENDFFDIDKPINIDIKLSLLDVEKGVFEDLFDPTDGSIINLFIKQETLEEPIKFYHKETNFNIPPNLVKSLIYISYNSVRNPNAELNFDKKRGVGVFLNFLILQYLKENQGQNNKVIDDTKLDKLCVSVNEVLNQIKPLKDFSVEASIDDKKEDVLSKLLILTENKKFDLSGSGCCGIQFTALMTLSILERLLKVSKYRLQKNVFEDESGKKYTPVLLGIDEPEIHLHPYMQRTLVKYLMKIIQNLDENFSKVIKKCFDIDEFIGQTIIVTHSPNMILDDYKQIIRFYKESTGNITVKSGSEIVLPQQEEKHLLMNMHYVKEAFFSKCVIIVEGESEFGAFPLFAEKMNIDLDELGISIIKASGADSISPLMSLFDKFGIMSVGVIDKDKYEEKKAKLSSLPNLYSTVQWDFEEELVKYYYDKNDFKSLKEILISYDSKGEERSLQFKRLNKTIQDYELECPELTEDTKFAQVEETNVELLKIMYLSWLDINKSTVLGRAIGSVIEKSEIPKVYADAITKAKELVQ